MARGVRRMIIRRQCTRVGERFLFGRLGQPCLGEQRGDVESERRPDRSERDRVGEREGLSVEEDGDEELQRRGEKLEHSQSRIRQATRGRGEQQERGGGGDSGEQQQHVLAIARGPGIAAALGEEEQIAGSDWG